MSITNFHQNYLEMRQHWRLVDDLLSGTIRMRDRTTLYLPRSRRETDDHYQTRLKLAYLKPDYADAVKNYVDRAFAQEPDVQMTNAAMREWFEDIDLAGSGISAMMRLAFKDAIHHGITYFLVDAPTLPEDRAHPSLYDQQRYNIRPYVVQIPSEDVFAWKADYINNRLQLTHVRYWEYYEADDPEDRWNRTTKRRIKVLEPGRWERRDEEGKLLQEGETGLDFIPFVVANINPVGFMNARPLAEALGDLSLAHFQSTADQRYIVHFSRVPILVFKGMQDDHPLDFGPGEAISLPWGAELEIVETSGIPAQVGSGDIEALEAEMRRLALEPLLPTAVSGDRSAYEAHLGDLPARSRLENAALAYKDCWEQIIAIMAKIANIKLAADEGFIDIKGNFQPPGSINDIVSLQTDVREFRLSHKTYLREAKRRNYISDDIDIEAEIASIEPPPLMGTPFDLSDDSDADPDAAE